MNKMKPKIIAIVGPTASGKTAIGVKLAKKFNGEIVSADSRQIFRGLDLGTGKDLSEYDDIKYHLIDICDPGEEFNLFKYAKLARTTIEDILSRGKIPIIVGGTGLYIQSLVEGFQLKTNYESRIMNYGVYSREQLENLSVEELQEILKKVDSEAFDNLSDQKNPHRLIRAIERAQSGFTMTKVKPDWDFLQIAIDLPKEILDKRIDKRADDRFAQGMLEEVEGLVKSGVNRDWLLKLGLEYRIITSFLISKSEFQISNKNLNSNNQSPKPNPGLDSRLRGNDKVGGGNDKEFEKMKETLKLRSHQYAKRQVTWFKRFPEVVWLSGYNEIEKRVQDYLGRNNS